MPVDGPCNLSGFGHRATRGFVGPSPRVASGGTGLGGEWKGRCAGWGLTRTAEGLSAEPDLVGALKVLDEGVGTEGGVLASGTAEVGGFAASEFLETLSPMGRRGPALLELVDEAS